MAAAKKVATEHGALHLLDVIDREVTEELVERLLIDGLRSIGSCRALHLTLLIAVKGIPIASLNPARYAEKKVLGHSHGEVFNIIDAPSSSAAKMEVDGHGSRYYSKLLEP